MCPHVWDRRKSRMRVVVRMAPTEKLDFIGNAMFGQALRSLLSHGARGFLLEVLHNDKLLDEDLLAVSETDEKEHGLFLLLVSLCEDRLRFCLQVLWCVAEMGESCREPVALSIINLFPSL